MHEYITTMIILAGIVVAVVLVVFLLKKLMPVRFIGNRNIKLVEQLTLGSKERVVLLKINQDMILVGVSAHGMSTLHVYKDTAVEPAVAPQDGMMNRPRI